MEGIANIAKQQQSQVAAQELQTRQTQQTQQSAPQQKDLVKEAQKDSMNLSKTLNSKKDVESLVEKLNDALAPISTNIKFGVDRNDVFYVSVIDAKTNKIIRRFPAEEAQKVLPKMQEVTGILFDRKG